jgi:hypothetical protein
MSELQTLKFSAQRTCENLGHSLKPWQIIEEDGREFAETKCRWCGCWVQCDNKKTNIGGTAIHCQCDRRKMLNCTKTDMNEPPNNSRFDRRCPFCKHEIPYFGLPWTTVITRFGETLRRRMGACPQCKRFVKAVMIWPDEGDGSGWVCEPVDTFEVEQVLDCTKEQHETQTS